MRVEQIPLAELRPMPGGRSVDQSNVTAIADSVKEVGILQPLRVRPAVFAIQGVETEGFEIIAGRHRYEAALALNMDTVPCVVVDDDDLHAELAMIDENLMRAELSAADRALSIAKRKLIYEALYPETKNGANQYTRVRKVCEPTFVDATAAALSVAKGEGSR